MKAKKLLALVLVLAMVVSLFPAVFAADEPGTQDPFSVEYAEESNTFGITVDGEAVTITRYNDYYYSAAEGDTTSVGPGKYGPSGNRDDCQLSIYVPEGATADSAVMFLIENGSWAQTGFKEVISAGASFDSTQNDRIALALKYNMIVVSYGARCRGSVDAEGSYIHAPQMVVDTKAAIRYVKYNIEQGLIPGDADKVIVSGHSGGGAMSAIIAATGNSSDYEAYLKNAAPATDDVFAVMASAPITDLAYADFAYEWTFGDYRAEAPYDSLSYKSYDAELSAALAARYVPYIEDNFGMTEEEYTAKIAEIFAASVQHELDLDAALQYSDVRPETDERGWFELDENGDVKSFDLEAYTEWAVNNAGIGAAYKGNELKGVMAFNSEGMTGGYMRNENNLWGSSEQAYSIAYAELWDLVKDPAAIGVDKYETFDEFWAAEGALVGMQMKMVSVMPYLTGSENMWYLEGLDASGDEVDVAPYWFIRHGMGDIDTSYATVASLMLAVEEKAENVNAYFGWERGHNGGGNTYYQEFFKWLADNGWISEANYANVEYVPNANEYQSMDIYVPNGTAPAGGWPVYIYVHGGGFTGGDKAEQGSSLKSALAALDEGYVVVAVNYTLPAELTEEALLAEIVDVKAAIRYLKANAAVYGINADKIVLTGPSAGGGLAEIVGVSWNSAIFDKALELIGAADADDKVAAIVAYAGAGHFNGKLVSTSIAALLDADDPAMFLRHGDADPVVNCSVSDGVAAAAKAAGVTVNYAKVAGAMHTFQNFFALYDVADTFDWLNAVLNGVAFDDVAESDWFSDEVLYSYINGLMNGVGENKFNPYGTASRAMIVTVLYRLAGSPAVETEAEFADLTADWYKDAVAWAVANGITKGTSDTTFEPDKAVTRQELATFLYRFADAEKTEADLSKYTDAGDIASWALDAMAWANAEGIINGKSETTLAPTATSNRAELATILARYIAK